MSDRYKCSKTAISKEFEVDDEDESALSLRELIVAQIRREALYRRIVRDEAAGRTPEADTPVENEKNADELSV